MRTLKPHASDTDHFVLGDGALACTVEWNRRTDREPYGLLLALPGRMARKEGTMLWHPEHRLRKTMLTVVVDGVRHSPMHESTTVAWNGSSVAIRWRAGDVDVEERLFMVSATSAALCREVSIVAGDRSCAVEIALYANPNLFDAFDTRASLRATGCDSVSLRALTTARYFERFCTVDVPPGDADSATVSRFEYSIESIELPATNNRVRSRDHESNVKAHVFDSPGAESPAHRVQRQLQHSCHGLRAAVSLDGRFNASLFQYEFEWGMDAAMVASAACASGDLRLAAAVLDNLLTRLSNDEGMIAEASRFRDGELSELNGNGAVLDAVSRYYRHTCNDEFIREHWERIVAIAGYPLRDEFQHESGLLKTRRDFWERYPWQGVGDGFELGHQVFCSVGLAAAAELATVVGDDLLAKQWSTASQRIREAMLEHPTYRLIENGRFIRRRRIDGSHEDALVPDTPWRRSEYAPYMPGDRDRSSIGETPATPKLCEPDVTEVLPIIYGLVDPNSDVARATLDAIDALWSPTGVGGYSRYNVASEPDSPGPWPFATAMVAAAELTVGLDARATRTIDWLLDAAGAGGSWLEYYGERESPPFPPIGIIVWGWAQYILLVVEQLAGIRVERDHIHIRPRGIGIEVQLRVGAFAVRVTITGLSKASIDGDVATLDDSALRIELPLTRDHTVEFE